MGLRRLGAHHQHPACATNGFPATPWLDEGRIRGYCFFFYDGEKGIIGDLFVHPELAGQGHERELLEHALETLLATPGLRRIEAQLPHFEREELEPCFLPRGFQSYLRRFMSLALKGSQPAGKPDPRRVRRGKRWVREGIELIPWHKRFNDDAAEMLYQSYREHVDATDQRSIRFGDGSNAAD